MEACYGEGGDREPRGEIGGAENSTLGFWSIFLDGKFIYENQLFLVFSKKISYF